MGPFTFLTVTGLKENVTLFTGFQASLIFSHEAV